MVQFKMAQDTLTLILSLLSRRDIHPYWRAMDFFERWLGFSGGRGDGSLEVLCLVVLGMIVLVTMFHFSTK